MLSITEAIFFGILQGLLEWLPVSSEGNLVLIIVSFFPHDFSNLLSYAIFLHLGTGLAALIYFRKYVKDLIIVRTKTNIIMRNQIVIITIITGIVGMPLYLLIDISTQFGETILAFIGVALILTGIIQRNSQKKEYMINNRKLTFKETIILGFVQGLSVIPGISRSGITSSFLLLTGFDKNEAFNFTFIMGIPVSFGASIGIMIFEKIHLYNELLIATLFSFLTGLLTIRFFLKIVNKMSFWKICILLGTISLISYFPNFLTNT